MEALDPDNDNPNFLLESTVAVGIDLGQSFDPTAIAIVERLDGRIVGTWRNSNAETRYRPLYVVRHLERLPLQMPYPDQVLYVASLLRREPLSDHLQGVYIDYTGVGRPVFDMFHSARLPKLHGISITAGNAAKTHGSIWSVPKGELVSNVQAKLHSGDLNIPDDLTDGKALTKELNDFKVQFTSAGNATFNARTGSHDDLVLALALGIYGLKPKRQTLVMSI